MFSGRRSAAYYHRFRLDLGRTEFFGSGSFITTRVKSYFKKRGLVKFVLQVVLLWTGWMSSFVLKGSLDRLGHAMLPAHKPLFYPLRIITFEWTKCHTVFLPGLCNGVTHHHILVSDVTSGPNYKYIGGQTIHEERKLPLAGLVVILRWQDQHKEKSKNIFCIWTSYCDGGANMLFSRFHMCAMVNVTRLNDEPMLGIKSLLETGASPQLSSLLLACDPYLVVRTSFLISGRRFWSPVSRLEIR